MSIILDLMVIAIILLTVFISAKRGFVRVLVETVGFILAIFISFAFSTPLAEATYDKIIEPKIIESVAEGAESLTVDNVNGAADKAIAVLPSWIGIGGEKAEDLKNSLVVSFTGAVGGEAHTVAENISKTAVRPIVVKPIELLYSVIILIVLLLLVKPLAKLFNKLFSFSIVGKLNRTLGGLVGIPKGIIIAVLFCMLITLIVGFTENGFLIFTEENINNTKIFSYLNF